MSFCMSFSAIEKYAIGKAFVKVAEDANIPTDKVNFTMENSGIFSAEYSTPNELMSWIWDFNKRIWIKE